MAYSFGYILFDNIGKRKFNFTVYAFPEYVQSVQLITFCTSLLNQLFSFILSDVKFYSNELIYVKITATPLRKHPVY